MEKAHLLIGFSLFFLNSGVILANQVVNGILGGSVYFYESIPIDADPVLQWSFQNTLIAQRFPGASPVCLNQFTGRCSLYVNGTLRLEDLRLSDDGDYIFSAQYPNSTFIKQSTYVLRVYSPVSDVKLTSNASELVWPGLDSVSLNCTARGADVTYSWSLQGAPLPQDRNYHLSENNTVLTISPVSDKDNGTFTCTAKNWIDSKTSNGVSFNLASPVSSVTLTSNTLGSYIWAGEESVTLHCSAMGSAITFLWNLNGEPLPADSRYYLSHGDSPPHSNLFISPVSRNDTGNFTCKAHNQLGSETSNALSLNLAWNPEGNMQCTAEPIDLNFQLGCSWSGGQPATNVILILSGRIWKSGVNSVTVVTTKSNFEGSSLICLGDQLGRTSQCSVIFVPPEAIGHNNNNITESKVGNTVNLTVMLVRGLSAEFTWYYLNPDPIPIQTNRNLLVESTNSSSSLHIPDVTMKDAGKYECRAKNFIGSQSFFFTVTVAANGLGGGVIAGIVIGVIFGVIFISSLVGYIIRKKKTPRSPIYENENISPLDKSTISVITTDQNVAKAESSQYEQIAFPNTATYSTLMPGQRN